jgi:hypothetical protein
MDETDVGSHMVTSHHYCLQDLQRSIASIFRLLKAAETTIIAFRN